MFVALENYSLGFNVWQVGAMWLKFLKCMPCLGIAFKP